MFDPSLPVDHSPNSAAEMRAQLQGLKALIDAVLTLTDAQVQGVATLNPGDPATAGVSVQGNTLVFSFGLPRGNDGANGQDGVSSPPVTSFLVDGVNTLNPGDNATVQAAFDGLSVRFVFGIPRGGDGGPGPAGAAFTNFLMDSVNTLNPWEAATVQTSFDGNAVRFQFGIPRGNDGAGGGQGPPGPSVANAVVDGVSTLNPWENAAVQTSFDGSAVHFQFGIPRGNDGANGGTGPAFTNLVVDGVSTLNPWENAWVQTSFDGSAVRFQFGIPRGNDGSQGPSGEVTNAQLSSAISGTSNNTNGIGTLGFAVSDPPTQGEVQSLVSKMDELINALRR